MKHTFAKKALLLGVIALTINNFPLAAMVEQPLPGNVVQQIAAKEKEYEKLTEKGLQETLKTNMKTLDGYWAKMMRCITGDKTTGDINTSRCTADQILLVFLALIAVMAIVRQISRRVDISGAATGMMKRGYHLGQEMGSRIGQGARGVVAEQAAAMRKRAARFVPSTP